MRYSVIGLGKLGCSMAAAIASRGQHVIGYDVDAGVVNRLAGGEAPVQETGLQELITASRPRLSATHLLADAVHGSDLSFVVVPTPSDDNGAFSLEAATAAFAGIGAALRHKTGRHTVVLTSTVLPGSVRNVLIPQLEQTSGRRVGEGLGVCYSPAFIALGSVIRDFLHPDMVLLGESDAMAGDQLERAYQAILGDAAPIRRMTLENAELAKIAVNTFVTTKISFANMLADLCERLPGGDVDVVTDALGFDRRIGRRYLTGALGYGGPCFPRDNKALAFLAQSLGTTAPIAEATDAVNRALPPRLVDRIIDMAPAGATVAVLGLAYKPATAVIEESQGVQIALELAAAGLRVLGHDPLAGAAVRTEHAGIIEVRDDVDSCVDDADVIVLTSPDPAYAALTRERLERPGRPRGIFDAWRMLTQLAGDGDGILYRCVGRGPALPQGGAAGDAAGRIEVAAT
jgi:UDPglucose 6-dehydrogenase